MGLKGYSLTSLAQEVRDALKTLASHVSNKSNPHGTTKAHVGLDKVPNYSASDSVTSTAAAFATSKAAKAAYDIGSLAVDKADDAKARADSAYTLAGSKINKTQADSYYLAKGAKAVDSDKLDGLNSTDFARAKHTHTPESIGAVAQVVLDRMFPVGHYLFTRNPANPSTYGYPGTWVMEEDDASVHTTTNSGLVGKITGSNTPVVPLPRHGHEAVVAPDGKHKHDLKYESSKFVERQGPNFSATRPWGTPEGETEEAGQHIHAVTIRENGTANATLDVRGRRLMLYVWERTK